MNNKELFAQNLKSARKKAGLSQAQLAEKISYSDKAISKWESGSALPPSEILPPLAGILETDLNSLFDFREEASYFLGIDGGGTKTKFLLKSKDGKTLNELTLGPSNPTSVGINASCDLFYNGIKEICKEIPFGKVSVFIGAAGCGITDNQNAVYERLASLKLSSLSVNSDAENIIAAGLKGENGVIAIMGTGSVIFVSKDEVHHRIGGYGHFIGDTFSGSEIGRACLEAVLSDLDGSGEKTNLTEKVTREKGTDVSKILVDMYKEGKTYMAALSHFVFECAKEGDAVANKIIEENVTKFAKLLSSALSMLPKDKKHPVVLAGGITNFKEIFIEKLKNKINAENLKDITVLDDQPVTGAVLLAMKGSKNNA
jgi:N-acetylglucosamine kinase-like BadF-type ATPase